MLISGVVETMATATVYFLNPDGSLRPVEQPGRCGRYWELYLIRENLAHRIAAETNLAQKAALTERYDLECHAARGHIEICPTCNAWLAAIEESQAAAPIEFEGVL